jgi:gliding motility-associated-like protein
MLNTSDYPYSYSVEFYNDEPGRRFQISIPQIASSLFLNINVSDNKTILDFKKNIPWFNSQYIIYRWNDNKLAFDSIGVTDNTTYSDSGLVNEVNYCYQVLSIGAPYTPGIISPYINFSNEACAIPKDTIPSCPPELSVFSECDSLYNYLVWNDPNNFCADDVIGYNIYYKNTYKGNFELIATINDSQDTTYFHYPDISMAACYGVTAIDSFLNESEFYAPLGVCVDECTYYELPNVFTPNGDDVNDIYMPKSYSFVERVDMKIYNRWGDLVYQTDDKNINWNGKILNTDKLVAPGVYYYICDVYEKRLHGIEPRNIVGFIHVYTDKNAKIDEEK